MFSDIVIVLHFLASHRNCNAMCSCNERNAVRFATVQWGYVIYGAQSIQGRTGQGGGEEQLENAVPGEEDR